MAKPHTPTKKTLLIAGAALVLVLVVGYIGRGFIRATVVPAYAKAFYLPGVHGASAKDLAEATKPLQNYGITYRTNYDECWSGANAQFEGLRETVTCIKSQESNAVTVSDELRRRWKTESSRLELRLLASGWHKQYNAAEPIIELLTRDYAASVNYAKNIGKVHCELSIAYTPHDAAASPDQMWSHQSCQRDVKFFGGY